MKDKLKLILETCNFPTSWDFVSKNNKKFLNIFLINIIQPVCDFGGKSGFSF